MAGSRDIYWLSSQASFLVEEKIEILRRFQIEVNVVSDFAQLTQAFLHKRLSTIIISDDFNDTKWKEQIQTLSIHPEYAGVHFILSISKFDRELTELAAALCFRDIITLDLTPEDWIQRYLFSTSGQPGDLIEPSPQLATRHIAALHVPGRISWMSQSEFWIETRLLPPLGTQLYLKGGPAAFLGLKKLSFKVLEHHKTHLHFRYSDALLCQWDLPSDIQEKKKPLLDFLSAQKKIEPFRIYTIVRSKEFRQDILIQLEPTRFDVSIALNKHNMVHEPPYIGPDAILIEDKMCQGLHRPNFIKMLEGLPFETPVFIIGQKFPADLYEDVPRRHLIQKIAYLPSNLANYLAEKIGQPMLIRGGVTFIPKYHQLSYARIVLPARILSMHPEAVRVGIPFELGHFSLSSLEAPFLQQNLGRRAHLKHIHGARPSRPAFKDFPYEFDALFVDLLKDDKSKLTHALLAYYQEVMSQQGFLKNPLSMPPNPTAAVELEQIFADIPIKNDIKKLPETTEDSQPTASEPSSLPGSPRIRQTLSFSMPVEWLVLILTVGLLVTMLIVIMKFRVAPNESNSLFIKQLRIFQEMQGPSPKSDPEFTPDE